jgi:hypothetical protein
MCMRQRLNYFGLLNAQRLRPHCNPYNQHTFRLSVYVQVLTLDLYLQLDD